MARTRSLRPQPRPRRSLPAPAAPAPLAYRPPQLMGLLGIGRAAAYDLAARIGIRVGKRRLVVPAAAVERWLAEGMRINGEAAP